MGRGAVADRHSPSDHNSDLVVGWLALTLAQSGLRDGRWQK